MSLKLWHKTVEETQLLKVVVVAPEIQPAILHLLRELEIQLPKRGLGIQPPEEGLQQEVPVQEGLGLQVLLLQTGKVVQHLLRQEEQLPARQVPAQKGQRIQELQLQDQPQVQLPDQPQVLPQLQLPEQEKHGAEKPKEIRAVQHQEVDQVVIRAVVAQQAAIHKK